MVGLVDILETGQVMLEVNLMADGMRELGTLKQNSMLNQKLTHGMLTKIFKKQNNKKK
jgi:hypothetical protein